jgi:hypothetical protein
MFRGQRNESLRPLICFPYRSRYFFFQAAPQLSSRGRVNPVPDPLLLRKLVAQGSEPETPGSVASNSDQYS